MHYFGHISQTAFSTPPTPFSRSDSADTIGHSLGAIMYMPGLRDALADDIVKQSAAGLRSVIVCLEDSVPTSSLSHAEHNTVQQLRVLAAMGPSPALIFIRVRAAEQIPDLLARLGEASAIVDGFVFPKFNAHTGPHFLATLRDASQQAQRRLLALPILESPDLLYTESRVAHIAATMQLLRPSKDVVASVHIGTTDLSSPLGLRRDSSTTIHELPPVAGAIGDMLNFLTRPDGFPVPGGVWEHYAPGRRSSATQGLIREIRADQALGMIGKTIVHPTHIAPVLASLPVTAEQHEDALDVVSVHSGGGAVGSQHKNKMNEGGPHYQWALRTIRRARAYGVLTPGLTNAQFLEELWS